MYVYVWIYGSFSQKLPGKKFHAPSDFSTQGLMPQSRKKRNKKKKKMNKKIAPE